MKIIYTPSERIALAELAKAAARVMRLRRRREARRSVGKGKPTAIPHAKVAEVRR